MREATHGGYPKYAVWENVPGAFSSNKGWDFLAVLEALCSICDSTISIPEPHDKKQPNKLVWNRAGEIVGDNFSICWRTLDAQYWGVPQRRKRIYLVTDFNTQCAREILFKPDSLRGNLPQSNGEREKVAADVVGSADGSVRAAGVSGNNQPVIALQGIGIDRADTAGCNGCGYRENEMYTLNTVDRPAVCYDTRNHKAQNISSTIQAKSNGGQSLNYINPVCYDARGNGDGETACTITGDHESRITDYTALAVQTICFNEGQITSPKNGNNPQWNEACHTLSATDNRAPTVIINPKPPHKYIIRRLMPVECARLQGFPNRWGQLAPFNPDDAEFWENVRKTYAEINGKKYKSIKDLKKWYDKFHNDSAEYKMWGNGIAFPCAEYVLHGISEHGAKTLGSLFDGSGGFPLAGTINGIVPAWSSEVEPYPIAVTKSRFK